MTYVALLAIALFLVAFLGWAFLPARRLPGRRARYCVCGCTCGFTRARASRTFSVVAALGADGCAAPLQAHPPVPADFYGSLDSRQHSVFLAAPITGTACASRWRSICW